MNDLKGIIEDCNKSDLVSDRVIKKVIEIIGQEEWQILHDENNDVCTTMGELIITLKGIADVEKENAELKEQNKSYEQLIDTGSVTLMKDRLKNYKQLTKAKDLIKNIIRVTWGKGWNYSLDWKVKAEQFLNSEVGK